MTPKEKAIELVRKYMAIELCELTKYSNGTRVGITSKQCALIAVDEILKQQQSQQNDMQWSCVTYWQEVKNEIEKL